MKSAILTEAKRRLISRRTKAALPLAKPLLLNVNTFWR